MPPNDNRYRSQERRFPKAEIKRVVWTYADAIHSFHASRIDHHPVLLHFRMHQNVGSACGGAMSALIARGSDADFSRRKFICEAKETAVRTGISAKAFLPQEINCHEAANEQKR